MSRKFPQVAKRKHLLASALTNCSAENFREIPNASTFYTNPTNDEAMNKKQIMISLQSIYWCFFMSIYTYKYLVNTEERSFSAATITEVCSSWLKKGKKLVFIEHSNLRNLSIISQVLDVYYVPLYRYIYQVFFFTFLKN